MKKKPVNRWRWWLLIIPAVLIILWPLLRPGFFISDDGEWMIIRLSAFFQSLRDGQFPTRWLGRLNHNYGYPVANFLYPGFLYAGSLLHLVGFSFSGAVKIILGASVSAAAFLVFAWLNCLFTPLASYLGTLAFLFSPYLFFDLYQRGSVGEIFALPAAALGFYSIESNQPWIFALAIGWLILGHNTLALLLVSLLVVYFLLKQRKNFWLPGLFGLGVSAFFWLPAIYEKRWVIFDLVSVAKPAEYFRQGNYLCLLGTVNLLAVLLLLFRRKRAFSPVKIFFLVASIVAMILATSLAAPVWQSNLLAKLVQFPYRTLAIALFTNAWIIAWLFTEIPPLQRWKLLVACLALWFLAFWQGAPRVEFVERPEGFYTTNEATTTVADEYLPRWVHIKPSQRTYQKIIFASGRGEIEVSQVTTRRLLARVTADGKGVLQLNTIYYPGWGVLLDSQPVEIDYDNSQGLIRFPVPAGEHQVRAEFRETPLRLLADGISAFSLVGYLAYLRFVSNKKT